MRAPSCRNPLSVYLIALLMRLLRISRTSRGSTVTILASSVTSISRRNPLASICGRTRGTSPRPARQGRCSRDADRAGPTGSSCTRSRRRRSISDGRAPPPSAAPRHRRRPAARWRRACAGDRRSAAAPPAACAARATPAPGTWSWPGSPSRPESRATCAASSAACSAARRAATSATSAPMSRSRLCSSSCSSSRACLTRSKLAMRTRSSSTENGLTRKSWAPLRSRSTRS